MQAISKTCFTTAIMNDTNKSEDGMDVTHDNLDRQIFDEPIVNALGQSIRPLGLWVGVGSDPL